MNTSTPVTEATSATALFQMMMFFKEETAATQEVNRAVLTELTEVRMDNTSLQIANGQLAQRQQQKHDAGIMYGSCIDSFISLLDDMMNTVPGATQFQAEARRIIQRADFAHHVFHGVNFIDLTTDETTDEDEELGEEEDETREFTF